MAFLDFGAADRAVDAVFVHANGFNALTYRQILAPLTSHYRILAIDQRGHGATTLESVGENRLDWVDLRDDLLAFLDALGLATVVLAGHSMGATASLLAAAANPSCCRSLALFDPVILPITSAPEQRNSPMVQAAARRRAIFPSRADAIRSYRGRGAFRTWPEPMLEDYVSAGFAILRLERSSLRARRIGRHRDTSPTVTTPRRRSHGRNAGSIYFAPKWAQPSIWKRPQPWLEIVCRSPPCRARHISADGETRTGSIGIGRRHRGLLPSRRQNVNPGVVRVRMRT